MRFPHSFVKVIAASLVGLGVTDSPASLGTDALKFSASRKQQSANLFTSAIEVTLEKGGYGSNLSPFILEILKYYFNGEVPEYALKGLPETATFSYNAETPAP